MNSRPDDMTDLIRKAAEYVGWHKMPFAILKRGELPSLDRYDIHALTGLVEDKVRESITFDVLLSSTEQVNTQVILYPPIPMENVLYEHKDPLIARLGALMQLVEKLND